MPLLGHLPSLLRKGRDNSQLAPGRFALEAKQEHGLEVMQLHIPFGNATLISVANPELVEEILRGDPKRFTKQLNNLGVAFDLMVKVFGSSGLLLCPTDDPQWGIAHRILKGPFAMKGVKGMFLLMREQAAKLVQALEREVGYGGVAHIDKWVTKMAFETIAVCGLGTSFGSFDNDDEHPFIAALSDVMTNLRTFSLLPKSLRRLYPKTMAALLRNARLLRGTCAAVIGDRRSHVTSNLCGKADLMDLMLSEKDPQTGQAMTESMVIDNVLTFLFAGQDSTAAAMATCLCFLASYPEAKEKLLQEIDEIVGTGELEWDDLPRLTYLDWCIKETLRLVPPVGAIVRNANGDQLLGGQWRIPDKAGVLVSIMALHYDRQLWGEDASLFKPERWEVGPPHKYAYLPFAAGPRACTGREFTVVEQKVTLVKLLQHFDLRRPAEVQAGENYHTVRKEDLLPPLQLGIDVEFKPVSAFTGVYSAFELLRR